VVLGHFINETSCDRRAYSFYTPSTGVTFASGLIRMWARSEMPLETVTFVNQLTISNPWAGMTVNGGGTSAPHQVHAEEQFPNISGQWPQWSQS